jgi:hypothetical protein
MNVKDLTLNLSTPRSGNLNIQTLPTNRIVAKHKKSISSFHGMTSFTPFNDNKILTAQTPRRLAEACYKQKDSFDQEFNKALTQNFKENLEIQEKRKKYEERKRKEEEFLALKEAKNKIKQEQLQRDKDDMRRGQEQLKKNQLALEEKKMKDCQFMKDRRSLYKEYINVRRKMQWEGVKKQREMSLDSLRLRKESLFN